MTAVDQLSELNEQRETLAGRMRLAADQLEASGLVDVSSLAAATDRYRDSFQQLTASLGLGDDATLDDLTSAVNRVRVMEPAAAVLKRVVNLRESGVEGASSVVSATRTAAEGLMARFAQRSTEVTADDLMAAETLTQGTHPLNRLLTLVDEPNSLSDEDWNRHVDSVRGAFGGDVATAVIRGRVAEVHESAALSEPVAEPDRVGNAVGDLNSHAGSDDTISPASIH